MSVVLQLPRLRKPNWPQYISITPVIHTRLANYLITCLFLSPGVQPVPLQTITNENPAGPSLGTIPQARFLLSMIHMLSLKHGSNSLSLLLNSGILALTQSILRLIGQCCLTCRTPGHIDGWSFFFFFNLSCLMLCVQGPAQTAARRT